MTVALVVLALIVLVMSGMWTGIALVIAGALGLFLSFGSLAPTQIGAAIWELSNSSTLLAIPLFLLIGELFADSKAAGDLFNSLTRLRRHISGASAFGAVLLGAMISCICGSLAAVTSIVTRTGYKRLRQDGLPPTESLGLVASVGCLGIMIPPSLTLIIYGSMTETPISSLFRVSFIPGIAQTFLFILLAASLWYWRAGKNTSPVSAGTADEPIIAAWQFPAVIVVILGLLIGGVASPTEAAAIGSVFALVFAMLNREFSFRKVALATRRTIVGTAMIMLIVLGAQMISITLAFQGFARDVSLLVQTLPLPDFGILLMIALLYIVLGMVFDGLSMMVLTLPFVFPAVLAMGMDPLWFGVMLVVCIQIAEISPPVGINLFVAQHITGEPIERIWAGVMPYMALLTIFLVFIIAYPEALLFFK
jgi:C4-dicarboxylate transporter DctM subunit